MNAPYGTVPLMSLLVTPSAETRGLMCFIDRFSLRVANPATLANFSVVFEPVRERVANFFVNFIAPVRVVKNVFRVKFKGVASEIACFGVSTIAGNACNRLRESHVEE
jgi:ABC-type transporter lipoprotein component MlaA